MKNSKQGPEAGFSLLSAIIALGIVGITAAMMTKTLSNNMKAAKYTELKGKAESIRRTIRNNMSCFETTGTKPAPPYALCSNTSYTLKNHKGNDMFGLNGKVGNSNFQVRAFCKNPDVGLQIEFRRIKDGRALKNPLTGIKSTYKPLIGVGLCDQYFGKKTPEQCTDDEVMVGIGPDGEPICKSVFERLKYHVCMQFADNGCGNNVGPIQCSPCMNELALKNEIRGAWAYDSNSYDPDCGRIVIKKCSSGHSNLIAPTAPAPSKDVTVVDTVLVNGNSRTQCNNLNCPAGYVSAGWGGRTSSGDINRCRLRCVKLSQ